MVDPLWVIVGYTAGSLVGAVLLFLFFDQIMGALDWLHSKLPWT